MKRIQASAAPLRAALSALLLGACLVQVSPALGQANSNPPERMTYQGFLVGSDGVALGNTNPRNYDVVFRIYDSENGNNVLWGEQQTVTVDKGFFNVLLGEGAAVGVRPALSSLFKGATASDRFVGITVNGIGAGGANVDILPRLRLMTSPYAFLAQNAVKLVQNNAGGADLLTSADNVVSLNGHFDILGNNSLEFGAGLSPKEVNNGRIGYQLYTTGLDIVGAGADVANRRISFHAQGGSSFNGPITAPSITATLNGDGSGITGVAKLGANTFTGQQDIQNHLRIGELASSGTTAGWGEALIFAGAPPLSAGWNSENSDPLWMARYNTAANSSELRMVIGDDNSGDAFVIGTMVGSGNFSQSATWSPVAAFTSRGLLDLGYGRTREVSAGTIGYQVHSSDSLDIVGAGTTGSNRKVQIWAEGGLQLNGHISNGLTVRGSAGDAFHVYTDYINVPNFSDKGRSAAMYRASDGLYMWLRGPSNHSTSDRYAYFNGDSNWDFTSDRRQKKDIVDAEPMLDRALKVQLRRFRWKTDPETNSLNLGVIAQELQPLFPDMVSVTTPPRSDGTEVVEDSEKMLAVGYSDFGMIAVKALQEFKALHDAEVKDLKAQVADLKAQMKEVLQAAAELRGQAEKSKVTASVSK